MAQSVAVTYLMDDLPPVSAMGLCQRSYEVGEGGGVRRKTLQMLTSDHSGAAFDGTATPRALAGAGRLAIINFFYKSSNPANPKDRVRARKLMTEECRKGN